MTLRETSRDAFFGLLLQRLEAVLPIIYTPTVAEACQRWSTLLHRPTGLYVSTQDKARLPSPQINAPNWPCRRLTFTASAAIYRVP